MMRVLCLALCFAIVPAAIAGNVRIERGAHTDAIRIGMILEEGDWRLDLANDCLKELFRAGGDGKTSRLLQILTLTDFDLSKVTIREAPQDPSRIRFGFEFTKADALKTVYWEAECPMNGPPPVDKRQTTTAQADPDRSR